MRGTDVIELKFKNKRLCDDVYAGIKKFEIRKNDRDYQVGDIIMPVPIEDDGKTRFDHPLGNSILKITYLVSEWDVALKDGYCVFGFEFVYKSPPLDDTDRNSLITSITE